MLIASWMVFGLLALLWTGGAWLMAGLTGWTAQALASGSAAQAAREVSALPVPEWVRLWMDPAWFEALQSALRWALDAAGAALPMAGTAAGWLVPLIWIVWALGFALLVLGAMGVHALLRRALRRPLAA